MTYEKKIARRMREALKEECSAETILAERKVLGILTFLINGHVACGLASDQIFLCLGEEGGAEALGLEHARKKAFMGGTEKSWVHVGAEGLRTSAQLKAWIGRAVRFVETLPPK